MISPRRVITIDGELPWCGFPSLLPIGLVFMPIYPGYDICTFTAHFIHTLSGVKWTNTFYYQASSANLTPSNIVAGCEAFKTQLHTVLSPLMHANVSLGYVSARVFISGGIVDGQTITTGLLGSTDGEEMLPLSAVVVVQKHTGVFGRSARGRFFFAGIAEDVNNSGFIAVDFNTQARAVATFLGADRTFAIPFHARHWDRKNNTFEPITSCVCLDKISTLRSRTKKTRGNPV